VRAGSSDLVDMQDVADCISAYAEVYSYRKDYVSPYTQGAIDAGLDRSKNLGGKPDDITVIAAQVKLI
jgi:hypothetical protein